MSKELEALKLLQIEYDKIDYTIDIDGVDVITLLRQALNELECAQHNYGALKEFYNNATAYGARIQKELNELKKRNEPMKPIVLTELEQVRPFPQTYKTVMCGNCKNQLSYNDKSRYCPDCGQAQDWSDEK